MEDDIKEATQIIVNKKNTAAVAGFIEAATKKMYDQQIEINQLKSNISNVAERMTVLENRLSAWKVQSTGHGPSVSNN
jgi:flagellar motility protein MotE (MotC chaperone)